MRDYPTLVLLAYDCIVLERKAEFITFKHSAKFLMLKFQRLK